jgi:hypothetical protein
MSNERMPKQVVFVTTEGKRKKVRSSKEEPDEVEEDMKVKEIRI